MHLPFLPLAFVRFGIHHKREYSPLNGLGVQLPVRVYIKTHNTACQEQFFLTFITRKMLPDEGQRSASVGAPVSVHLRIQGAILPRAPIQGRVQDFSLV